MTPRLLRGAFAFLLCCGIAGSAFAQNGLSIPNASTAGLTPVNMNVRMDNAGAVQGFVVAVQHTGTVEVTSINAAGAATAAGAELVVGEIFPGEMGFTLGVVLDATAPFGGQTIAAGAGQTIASFGVQPLMADTTADFTFVDGVLNDPVLSNVLVIGGLSIGAGQGLSLTGGTLTIGPIPPGALTIEDTSAASDGCAAARILMDSDSNVQGFVLAIAHDGAALTLSGINLTGTATAAAGAEFVVPNTSPGGGTGGTLGVVLDFDAPFGGQTIAAGVGVHIANFVYCCNTEILDPDPAQTTDLTFVNGVLGSPALDNVIVVGGLSINPSLVNGTFTCLPIVPPGEVMFYCGNSTGPGQIDGLPGETVDVCFYYTSEEENIQGFQLAVCFDCNLTFGDFSIEGSIADAVGAEFVNWTVDNDPNDGDGCEFVAGILLDALPPFGGQTVPQTTDPLLIGCVDVTISDDPALCDTLLTVEFCDGINGAGAVAIENIVVIDYTSFQDIAYENCAVYVLPVPTFIRGDCNHDLKVDLADSATVIGQQFMGIPVDCKDACDANDDGKINLADSVFLLNYIFKSGDAPPDPGPDLDEGPDPTDDTLDCETAACAP